MKYSKEKKEKIKKGATATAGALLVIGATIGATLGVVSAVQGAKTETEVETLRKALFWLEDKMNKKVDDLQFELKKAQFELGGANKEVRKLKNNLSGMWKEIFVLNDEITALRVENASLRADLKTVVKNFNGKGVKRIQEILPNFRYLISKYGEKGNK